MDSIRSNMDTAGRNVHSRNTDTVDSTDMERTRSRGMERMRRDKNKAGSNSYAKTTRSRQMG
jgi:hypothetical protein